jgi:hypothetical protein
MKTHGMRMKNECATVFKREGEENEEEGGEEEKAEVGRRDGGGRQ